MDVKKYFEKKMPLFEKKTYKNVKLVWSLSHKFGFYLIISIAILILAHHIIWLGRFVIDVKLKGRSMLN